MLFTVFSENDKIKSAGDVLGTHSMCSYICIALSIYWPMKFISTYNVNSELQLFSTYST